MYPIDITVSKIHFLLNDFFRHLHRRYKFKIFLCGEKPDNPHFDLRFQLKRILELRMGCKPFLGEELEDLKVDIKTEKDHLTIEVKEAENADLTLMFLGSPGTIAELTAFVLNENIRSKVIVFNDRKYEKEKSFLNQGPLKLLEKDHLLYYDPLSDIPSKEFVLNVDKLIAVNWYQKSVLEKSSLDNLVFHEFIALVLIYAIYPIQYKELSYIYPFEEYVLNNSLKTLFNLKLLKKEENKYIPTKVLEELPATRGCINDVAMVRLSLLNKRLIDSDVVTEYRLIL